MKQIEDAEKSKADKAKEKEERERKRLEKAKQKSIKGSYIAIYVANYIALVATYTCKITVVKIYLHYSYFCIIIFINFTSYAKREEERRNG